MLESALKNARAVEKTQVFMAELLALMEKHQLAVVPEQEGTVSAHDPMRVVPLDAFWRSYYAERVYTQP